MNISLSENTNSSDIAIIGLGVRAPGANSIEQLWWNLRNGIESVKFFEDRELRAAGVPEAMLKDPLYVKAGTNFDGMDVISIRHRIIQSLE